MTVPVFFKSLFTDCFPGVSVLQFCRVDDTVPLNNVFSKGDSMENRSASSHERVLILGGTGFVGKHLIHQLTGKGIKLRILVRDPAKAASVIKPSSALEIVPGDLVENEGLPEALQGVRTAYYLVHSMGGRSVFRNKAYANRDKTAARNFMAAAEQEGLERIIYLGALGEAGDELSEHLKSRADIAQILSSGTPRTTILRAAIIIGAGGASFEMLRYLVERLPVMGCPKWIHTRIQPIALRDVMAYLVGCLLNPDTTGKTFDIGGPDILTYKEMMQAYAEARGLAKRFIFDVFWLTPLLSAYWVDLVTPIPSGVAHPLIEGLKNEVICRDSSIDAYVPLDKISYKESVRIAFSEETSGPGITGF